MTAEIEITMYCATFEGGTVFVSFRV